MSHDGTTSKERGPIATRIDPAHVVRPAASVSTPVPCVELAAAAAGRPEISARQDLIDRHAQSIMERLRDSQRELDRREAEFNARVAQAEAELRAVRLATIERAELLSQRERTLEEQARVLSERSVDIAAAEWSRRSRGPLPRDADEASGPRMQQTIAEWRNKILELESQERKLQTQFADLSSEQRNLAEQRAAFLEEKAKQQAALEADRMTIHLQREEQSRDMAKRAQTLDRRQEAVRNMHSDLSRIYRETIESQLGAEQLWAQMTERTSDTEIAVKLAELRARLSDEYQLAAQHLIEQKSEIQTLLEELRHSDQAVTEQRTELREWFHRRQQEMEAQAVRLLECERELDRKEQSFRFAERQHEQQRRVLEQEVRRLRRLVNVA
jgi:DNA repair exonuclease SbcCD ATPase subunit